ncbi:MAG: hypothetical protein KC912_00825 [Proteobacteria bacterium]|nr:hypothetical protein [Pseudomonadota bacterium]
MISLLLSLAFASPPDTTAVWSSEGRRVLAHCLLEDGRWAGLESKVLHRGPDLEPIAGEFGKHALVVGDCEAIAFAADRARQVSLLDPWTGEIRVVETGVQFHHMVVAPDGRYIVVGGWDGGDAVVVVDVKAGSGRRLDGAVSYVDWRFSEDGTLFRYAKSYKQKSHSIRDIDSFAKVAEDASQTFSMAATTTAIDQWKTRWQLTDDIKALASDHGVFRVVSDEKKTEPLGPSAQRLHVSDDDTLLLFGQSATHAGGVSAEVWQLDAARPTLLRWYLQSAP